MKHSPVVEKTILFANEKPLMDFYAALKAIAEGEKITKLEWSDDRIYGVQVDGVLMLHKADDKLYQWIIRIDDFAGDDWVIIP